MAEKISLGISSYNRPRVLSQVLSGVTEHLTSVLDNVYIYDDGSSENYDEAVGNYPDFSFERGEKNLGVAHAKNILLHRMMDAGAERLFLGEDDILPTSPLAVSGYITAARASGWEHLNFHHSSLNRQHAQSEGLVTYWPQYSGTWALYSRRCIEEVGFFDESFVNAFEHCEHTIRCGLAGFTSLPDEYSYHVADATGSELWLHEMDTPSVRSTRTGWSYEIIRAKRHWKATNPETYRMVFG